MTASTTQFSPGDIVLLSFPFSSETRRKQRPALVLLDAEDRDLLVARVTTQPYHSAFDIAIKQWKEAGLRAPSVVRLHKLATVEKGLVKARLGRLREGNWAAIRAHLRERVFTL